MPVTGEIDRHQFIGDLVESRPDPFVTAARESLPPTNGY